MNRFDLIKTDSTIYRVLAIKEKILVIDCIRRKMPFWVEKLSGTPTTEQDLQLETGIKPPDIDDLSPNARKIAYEHYVVIASAAAVVDDIPTRNTMIELASKQHSLSKQTIRNYLCLYLSFQEISVFAPITKPKRELTFDEKNMRWALNKFFFTRNENSLKTAYELMLKSRYCDEYGKLLTDYPSFYRFRYFYRKYRKEERMIISRKGLKAYQKDFRPLLGDGIQSYAPNIGTAMIDSTICDVYLVNDQGKLVGRPVLAIACDANTSLCLGYCIGWEGTTYSLIRLLLCILEDKTILCRSKGIGISQRQWNISGCLPSVFVTDGGSEYTAKQFSQLTELGITIIKEPPYRADLKGVVEKAFDIIQSLYKDTLKGRGGIMPDFRQRGSHDYRKDACLTLQDFERIIVRCIVFYNSERILESYPFTEKTIGVKPYASDLWNAKMRSEGKNLLGIDKQQLILTLFPRTMGKFSRSGLKVNRLRYQRPGFKEEFLKGGEVEVTYNPDDVSFVWIKDNTGTFIAFKLIESRFMEKTVEEVESILSEQKVIIQSEQEKGYQAKIDLLTYLENVVSGKKTKNTEIKGVRKTRAKEKRRNHKDLGGEIDVDN